MPLLPLTSIPPPGTTPGTTLTQVRNFTPQNGDLAAKSIRMRIILEVSSAIAMQRHRVCLNIPPIRANEYTGAASMQVSVEPWFPENDMSTKGATKRPQDYELKPRDVELLARAVGGTQVVAPIDSSKISTTVDGWTTKLTLEVLGSTLMLGWFCEPPPAWVGVSELCEAIERLVLEYGESRHS